MRKGKTRNEALNKAIKALEERIGRDVDFGKFRKRIEIEDKLLNERTNIFILTNSLWLLVVGFIEDMRLPFIFIGIFICVFWLICSIQSRRVIGHLTGKYLNSLEKYGDKHLDDNQQLVENIVQSALPHHEYRIRPTEILSVWLPFLLLEGWLLLLFHTLKILKAEWIIVSALVLLGIAIFFFLPKSKKKK